MTELRGYQNDSFVRFTAIESAHNPILVAPTWERHCRIKFANAMQKAQMHG